MPDSKIRSTPALRVTAFVAVTFALRSAAAILVPLALAAFLGIAAYPIQRRLRRWRVPLSVAVGFTVCIVAGVFLVGGYVTMQSLGELGDAMPRYMTQLAAYEKGVLEDIARLGLAAPKSVLGGLFRGDSGMLVVGALVRAAAEVTAGVLVVLVLLVFLLAESAELPTRLTLFVGRPDLSLERAKDAISHVQVYVALKVALSLLTGVVVALGTYWIGIDFAAFWGVTAFALNFVPGVGVVIAAVPPILVALATGGPSAALTVAALYAVVHVVLANVLEPALMGRGFGLSPLSIMLGLLYWGFVWGAAGMLLAVPLTIAIRVALEHSSQGSRFALFLRPAREIASAAATSAGATP